MHREKKNGELEERRFRRKDVWGMGVWCMSGGGKGEEGGERRKGDKGEENASDSGVGGVGELEGGENIV